MQFQSCSLPAYFDTDLHVLCHELRTPLNGVLGFAQLLERAELEERHRQYVEAILLSAGRLEDLIVDTLERIAEQAALASVQ